MLKGRRSAAEDAPQGVVWHTYYTHCVGVVLLLNVLYFYALAVVVLALRSLRLYFAPVGVPFRPEIQHY